MQVRKLDPSLLELLRDGTTGIGELLPVWIDLADNLKIEDLHRLGRLLARELRPGRPTLTVRLNAGHIAALSDDPAVIFMRLPRQLHRHG